MTTYEVKICIKYQIQANSREEAKIAAQVEFCSDMDKGIYFDVDTLVGKPLIDETIRPDYYRL